MHSVAKGKQWFFGMLCHNRHAEAKSYGVDAASGLVYGPAYN